MENKTDEMVWFHLTPKKDITVYELAAILGVMQMAISENLLNRMPVKIKRHFTPSKNHTELTEPTNGK